MNKIEFHILQTNSQSTFELISDWYLKEWDIPTEKTRLKLETVATDNSQFQVIMIIDNIPIATGGIYSHVGLLDIEPRFKIYKPWLALVYTIPNKRHQGYGAMLCNYIQNHAKTLGFESIYLFTDTAERLYTRLGWKKIEDVNIRQRNIAIMTKIL